VEGDVDCVTGNEQKTKKERKYPELYEKLIPLVLGAIVVAMLALLAIAVAVALRLLPGASY
jgi:hypothetical protein